MSAASFISMAGALFLLGYEGLAYITGWTGGYVLLLLLLVPYLRKFGHFTIPDFIGARYPGAATRIIGALIAIIIIGREIAISSLREWMAIIGATKSVAVHMIGKLKTTVQMVAIPFLLFDGDVLGLIDSRVWGTWLIWLAAVLTIWSMVYYLQKALPEIRARSR